MTAPDLTALVSAAEAEDLPRLIGQLEQAKALAWAKLAGPTQGPQDSTAERDALLTMPEVAAHLGITEHQAREMGRRGELPVVTVGERFVRVRARTLADWIRRREGATLSRAGGR